MSPFNGFEHLAAFGFGDGDGWAQLAVDVQGKGGDALPIQ